MRKRIGYLLLALGLWAIPLEVRAQGPDPAASASPFALWPPPRIFRGQDTDYTYEVPPVVFTGPLSHPRYETGGFYVGAEFLYIKPSNPLRDQLLAIRGFLDVDGSITGRAGTFVGSGAEALNVNQVSGASNFQPGFNLFAGWRFENGVTVEASWWHLFDVRQSGSASTIGPEFNVGANLQNTLLFAPVSNFSPEFAGAPNNLPVGNPGATYGIWNAAQTMQIDFVQRFDMGQINLRIPVWQTDCYRSYALIGPRLVTIFERFTWRTVSADASGLADPSTVAQYSNTVSNRLYGAYVGCGNDYYLGNTPIGAFSFVADFNAGLYIDLGKGRADYETELRNIGARRARNMSSLVPGAEAKLGFQWYPWEAVSLYVGYDFLAFFNTIASPRPVDFNMGTLNPEYDTGILRFYHGLMMGVSFVF